MQDVLAATVIKDSHHKAQHPVSSHLGLSTRNTHTFKITPGNLWAPRVSGEPPRLTPATSGPCLLVDSPSGFPFPILNFPTSLHSRDFPWSPGCSTGCWAAHKRLPGLYHPALRAREEPGVSNRDNQWCNGWGNLPVGGKVLG